MIPIGLRVSLAHWPRAIACKLALIDAGRAALQAGAVAACASSKQINFDGSNHARASVTRARPLAGSIKDSEPERNANELLMVITAHTALLDDRLELHANTRTTNKRHKFEFELFILTSDAHVSAAQVRSLDSQMSVVF